MPTQPTPDAPATADTQTAAAPDTGANTQQSPQPMDWESRYKASQAELTRKSQALIAKDQELDELRISGEGDEEGDDTPRVRKSNRQSEAVAAMQERLEEAEWTIARAIYDEPTIDAYATAATLLEKADTAADHVAAFEAYHQARLGGATPAVAASAPAGAPPPAAVQPRVDSNRSDAPVLPDVEAQLREATEKHDLGAGIRAILAQAGLRK
jgi:Skp family chaperone for outer membrane proteins